MEEIRGFESNWARVALWNGPRHYNAHGKYRWGVQLMPSIAIGLPLALSNPAGDTAKALGNTRTVGGILIRVTPLSFYVSAQFFVGTADIAKKVVFKEEYATPALLLYGGGIDVFGGALSLTYVHAMLRKDGLFSEKVDATDYLQLGIDLTAIAIGAAGAVNGTERK